MEGLLAEEHIIVEKQTEKSVLEIDVIPSEYTEKRTGGNENVCSQ